MRRIVLLSLFALLVAEGASAQRRGGIARGFVRGGTGFNRARMAYRGGYGYGYGSFSSDDGESYEHAPRPIYLVQPAPPPPVVEPPAPPARPVATDYQWTPGPAAPVTEEAQNFEIVLKDGSTLSATSVMAADDVLHYVDPEERHMRISMRDVDRSATLKLNRERRLNLYLPASPQ